MSLFWQIISVSLLAVVFFLASLPLRKSKEDKLLLPARKLTPKEAEWMADYFHCDENAPDMDGYVGHYTLPSEVMKIYNAKHGKERGFE